MTAVRFTRADDAVDPEELSRIVGQIRSVARTRLTTSGYSTARHERVEILPAPLSEEQEGRLLAALAGLHAQFWS